jgi:hypothetical protein
MGKCKGAKLLSHDRQVSGTEEPKRNNSHFRDFLAMSSGHSAIWIA